MSSVVHSPSLSVFGAACQPEISLLPAGSPAVDPSASFASWSWCGHLHYSSNPAPKVVLQPAVHPTGCPVISQNSMKHLLPALRTSEQTQAPTACISLHSTAGNPAAAVQFGNGEERRHVKWYRNEKFWVVVFSVLVTEALLVTAIIMVVRHNNSKIIYFETWRWLFFFAGEPLPSAFHLGLLGV